MEDENTEELNFNVEDTEKDIFEIIEKVLPGK